MSSKKRRRLYEGFGVLDEENTNSTPIEHHTDTIDVSLEETSLENKETFNGVGKESKHTLNRVEVVSKKEVISVESESKNTETVSKHTFKDTLNGVQSTPNQHQLNTVVGKEREFLFFIVQECQNNGALETKPLTSEKIKLALNYSTDGLKTVIYRLTKKGIIERAEVKTGRTGWVSYRVGKDIFEAVLKEKESLNGVDLVFKQAFKQSHQALNSSSIDLSINKNTTSILIPENLRTLISKHEISDLIQKELMEEADLKESLEHFSYDLANNLVRAKTNPINLFFGLTRTGKKYRSLALIEQQNNDLRAYQEQLEALEAQEKELKQKALKHKFEEFKAKNPSFIEKVALENPMASEPSVIENLAFQQFIEKNA